MTIKIVFSIFFLFLFELYTKYESVHLKIVAGDGLFGRLSSYHSLAANGGMETRTVHGKHRYSVHANSQNFYSFIYNEFLELDYHKLSFK